MGLFSGQLANVVEWKEFNEEMIFWKWSNEEIKKGSKLIIRPGQDAIFMFNGKIAGYFPDANDVNESDLGMYMLGAKHQPEEEIGGALND